MTSMRYIYVLRVSSEVRGVRLCSSANNDNKNAAYHAREIPTYQYHKS